MRCQDLFFKSFSSLPISVPKYLHQTVVQTSGAPKLVPTLNFKAFLSCFLVVRFSRYSKSNVLFRIKRTYLSFPLDLDQMKYIYWKWRGQKYVLGARLLSSAQRWGGIYLSMSSAHVTCTSCRMYVYTVQAYLNMIDNMFTKVFKCIVLHYLAAHWTVYSVLYTPTWKCKGSTEKML